MAGIFPEFFQKFNDTLENEFHGKSEEHISRFITKRILDFSRAWVSQPAVLDFWRVELFCLRKFSTVRMSRKITEDLLKQRLVISDHLACTFQQLHRSELDKQFILNFRVKCCFFSVAVTAAQLSVLEEKNPSASNISYACEIFTEIRSQFKKAKLLAPKNFPINCDSTVDFIFGEIFPLALPLIPAASLPALVGSSESLHFEDVDRIWRKVATEQKYLREVIECHREADIATRAAKNAWRKNIEPATEKKNAVVPKSENLETPRGPWRWAGAFVQGRRSSAGTSRLSDVGMPKISQEAFQDLLKEWNNTADQSEDVAMTPVEPVTRSSRRSSLLSAENFYEGKNLPVIPALRIPPKRRRSSNENSPTLAALTDMPESPAKKSARVLVAETPDVGTVKKRSSINFENIPPINIALKFESGSQSARLPGEKSRLIGTPVKSRLSGIISEAWTEMDTGSVSTRSQARKSEN